MELWSRWRADLRRGGVPVSRDERRFLFLAPVVIVVLAQVTDSGPIALLVLMVPVVGAFWLWAVWARLPAEAFAALVVVPVATAVAIDGDLEGAFFLPTLVVLYTAWSLGSTTRAAAIALVAGATPWLVADHLEPAAGIAWTPWALAHGFTFLMGRTLRRQRLLISELHTARAALATQAVAEERRRIARELHDLAGHTLAAMLLHVTGARHVLRRDVHEADAALGDAESVGRASLDQVRATVAALRTDEAGTDPALASTADLADLVEGYRRAGLDVSLRFDEAAANVDGPVGTAAHRIAREALANVARHAPANTVEVVTEVRDGDVHLRVTDRGGRPAPVDDGPHYGLLGMTERARALGGHLHAGPRRDGWEVEATLPRHRPAVEAGAEAGADATAHGEAS